MQTLKIEIPTGYEIDSFNKASGEIKFKAKPQNIINSTCHGLTCRPAFGSAFIGLRLRSALVFTSSPRNWLNMPPHNSLMYTDNSCYEK